MGGGIAVYFALPAEPSLLTAVVPVVVMLAWRASGGARTTLPSLLIAALLAGALGFALAKLRVEWVRAPVLTKQMNGAEVRGFVELIEARPARGQRLTLRVTALGDLPERARPTRVRVTTNRSLPGLQPGAVVRLRATLMPRRSRHCPAITTSGGRRGLPASAPSAMRCRRRAWTSPPVKCQAT